ncbi:MAG TPA: G5 domain-containing protein, partial [Candidatus Saccharimonadales bacterium]
DDFVGESALGLKLTVVRATKLKLSLYGTTKSIRTQASTVGELLDQHGLDPSADDIVRPKEDSKIKSNMTVYLVRVSGDTVVKEETIPFPVREIRDKSKPLGWEDVQKAGQNGSKLVTYQITFENGQEVSREVLSSVTVQQPVEQVIVVGDKYDLAEAFAKLRQCEATGNYAANTGNGFYGAYQFVYGTWQAYAPADWKSVYPHKAPPSVQDQAALNLYNVSGWGSWPGCTAKLGLY